MRFVRVFLSRETGAPIRVVESESLACAGILDAAGATPFEDFGLVADLDATLPDGSSCTLSAALLARLEKHPLADTHADAPKVRLMPEHANYARRWFSPCCVKTLGAHVRARGVEGLPGVTKAWLASIMPSDLTQQMGLPHTASVALLKSMERNRRGTPDAGVVQRLERDAQMQSDARSAVALGRRKRINEANSITTQKVDLKLQEPK